ncbi:heme o synthase [Olivibacter sitiensis]|uniref:heme o synthase n=1 Tax=Olivibacter sitiensis TaxID=376470 RepID=UPI000401B36C|nr:heme o synthase [Olivibacter sitiensis]
MKDFINDLKQLVKIRLTLTVVFSASISFLIGSKWQGDINWINWAMLTIGGFLVTGSANGFNEIIEKDLDKLMVRTASRPLPSGRMTTGQALVLSLLMGLFGTLLLLRLNFLTGVLSVFSILLYAFVYTPMKRISPIAVFIGAFPGALPPLIGYFAAFEQPFINEIPLVLFAVQFVWQFPHFWSIAWVVDEDYRRAGFRLLPTTKRDTVSAWFVLITALLLIPTALLPYILGFAGLVYAVFVVVLCAVFAWFAFVLVLKQDIPSARKVMFTSFFILPVLQLVMLFDFVRI